MSDRFELKLLGVADLSGGSIVTDGPKLLPLIIVGDLKHLKIQILMHTFFWYFKKWKEDSGDVTIY